jgi:hypothetical protein
MDYISRIEGISDEGHGLRLSIFVPYLTPTIEEPETEESIKRKDSLIAYNSYIKRLHAGECTLLQSIDSSENVVEKKKEIKNAVSDDGFVEKNAF